MLSRIKLAALGFFFAAILFITTSVLIAWTGPASAPPSGNVDAPVNVGATDQVKNAGLSLNALAVFGNAILSGTSRYLNFGTTAGATGYGIRDNTGTMEVKDSSGAWARFATTTSNGTVANIRFTDGTTQTTAQAASDSGTMCGLATAELWGSCYQDTDWRGNTLYGSVATCKGQSIAASCPTGYTPQTITMSQVYQTCTGACQPRYYCARICTKN